MFMLLFNWICIVVSFNKNKILNGPRLCLEELVHPNYVSCFVEICAFLDWKRSPVDPILAFLHSSHIALVVITAGGGRSWEPGCTDLSQMAILVFAIVFVFSWSDLTQDEMLLAFSLAPKIIYNCIQ